MELGFSNCRITRPDSIPLAPDHLAAFIGEERHGDMDWLAERFNWRSDPRQLWPETRSIVILSVNYGPNEPALAGLARKSCGNISVYARHRDYHDVVKGKLKQLAGWLLASAGRVNPPAQVKVFVDTAPVMEKPLAEAAGLGWQGKHTNLVSREFGSWLFLGSIFTTLELLADQPETDHCGSCQLCLDSCPTQALTPYQIDARACISYLTIEAKSQVPLIYRQKIGNRIYGCDDCLAVCPWNKFAQSTQEAKLQARAELASPPLAELASMDEKQFRVFFAGGPIKRIGHVRFLRNVLLAIGNSGDISLVSLVLSRLDHEAPLVRGMAVWALAQLVPPNALAAEAFRWRPTEVDVDVRGEWDLALTQGEAS